MLGMSRTIVECVPNFSEGRDAAKIDAIVEAIRSVPGVVLLDREVDADHNRSVLTFAGPPATVVEAAFRGVEKAVVADRSHQARRRRIRVSAQPTLCRSCRWKASRWRIASHSPNERGAARFGDAAGCRSIFTKRRRAVPTASTWRTSGADSSKALREEVRDESGPPAGFRRSRTASHAPAPRWLARANF